MTATQPPSPVPERPLSAMDLADGAFGILRARPRVVATIVAVFVLPSQLLSSWLNRAFFASISFDSFDPESPEYAQQNELGPLAQAGESFESILIQLAVLPLIGVALTHLVLGWRQGEERSARQCITFTLKRTHIIMAALVMSKVIQVFSLFFLTPMTMLVAPVIAAEDVGPITAVKRSFELGKRRYGPLLATLLLVVLMNVLLGNALSTLPTLAAFALDDWGWVAFFALSTLGAAVLTILGVGVSVLCYLDVMNRTEGTDIQRRLRAIAT